MKRKAILGVISLVLLCFTIIGCHSRKPCKAGSDGCICTSSGECNRGRCIDNRCVVANNGDSGDATANTNGDDGESNSTVDAGGYSDKDIVRRITCEEADCSRLATCIDQKQGYACQCPSGYSGDGRGQQGCMDINECLTDNGNCDPLATCINIEGSYICGPCPDNYIGDGYTGCIAPWIKQIGVARSTTYGWSVATDNRGNIFVTGTTSGPLFDEIHSGVEDVFIVSYDSEGIRRWATLLGTDGTEGGASITTDGEGNVYVTGKTRGDLDGYTNAGGEDLIIAKYDNAGTKKWSRQLGTDRNDAGYSIATDSNGNVYITGEVSDLYEETDPGIERDLVVYKYDNEGDHQWTRHIDTDYSSAGYGIGTDENGDVYVAGYAWLTLEGQTYASRRDIVIKYDSDGVLQWPNQFVIVSDQIAVEGDTISVEGNAMAVDDDGNVYVTGAVWGELEGNASAGAGDLFVIKFDREGIKQWTRQYGSSDHDEANGITTDNNRNIYLTGQTRGDFGSPNAGLIDTFVAKFDSDGSHHWTRQLGTAHDDTGCDVATDDYKNIYVVGNTSGTLIGNSKWGVLDAFLVKTVDASD